MNPPPPPPEGSSEWLRGIVDAVPGAIYRCRPDPARTVIFISAGCRVISGLSPADLGGETGCGLARLIHPEDVPLVTRVINGALAAREPFEVAYRLRRNDSSFRWVEERGRGVFGPDGALEAVEGHIADVTIERSERAQLAEKDRIVSALFDQTFQLIALLDRDGRVMRANRAFVALLGPGVRSVTGHKIWDTPWWSHDPGARDRVRAAVAAAAAGELVRLETTHQTHDGRVLDVDFSINPVRDEGGRVIALLSEARDMTDRRTAERARADSEEKFARAFAACPDSISITDLATGRFVEVNESFERLFEWRRHEVVGRTSQELGLWADAGDRDRLIEGLIQHGRVRELAADGRSRSGRIVHCQISGELVDIGGSQSIILIIRDVTEALRSEVALRASEERLRLLIEHAPDAIVVFDVSMGVFVAANAAAERLFGTPREQLLGRAPTDFSPERQPDGRSSVEVARGYLAEAVAGGRPVFEWMHRTAAGDDVPCEVHLLRLPSTDTVLIRGNITDLTERKVASASIERLQRDLEQLLAERSAQLAVAHAELESLRQQKPDRS